MVPWREAEVGDGPDAAELDGVVLATGRHRRVGQVRDARQQVVQLGLDLPEPLLGAVDLATEVLEAGEDLGTALGSGLGDLLAAALLLGAQAVDLGDQGTPRRVQLQQPVDRVGHTLAAARQGLPDHLRVVTDELEIEHAWPPENRAQTEENPLAGRLLPGDQA